MVKKLKMNFVKKLKS